MTFMALRKRACPCLVVKPGRRVGDWRPRKSGQYGGFEAEDTKPLSEALFVAWLDEALLGMDAQGRSGEAMTNAASPAPPGGHRTTVHPHHPGPKKRRRRPGRPGCLSHGLVLPARKTAPSLMCDVG